MYYQIYITNLIILPKKLSFVMIKNHVGTSSKKQFKNVIQEKNSAYRQYFSTLGMNTCLKSARLSKTNWTWKWKIIGELS